MLGFQDEEMLVKNWLTVSCILIMSKMRGCRIITTTIWWILDASVMGRIFDWVFLEELWTQLCATIYKGQACSAEMHIMAFVDWNHFVSHDFYFRESNWAESCAISQKHSIWQWCKCSYFPLSYVYYILFLIRITGETAGERAISCIYIWVIPKELQIEWTKCWKFVLNLSNWSIANITIIFTDSIRKESFIFMDARQVSSSWKIVIIVIIIMLVFLDLIFLFLLLFNVLMHAVLAVQVLLLHPLLLPYPSNWCV